MLMFQMSYLIEMDQLKEFLSVQHLDKEEPVLVHHLEEQPHHLEEPVHHLEELPHLHNKYFLKELVHRLEDSLLVHHIKLFLKEDLVKEQELIQMFQM